MLSPISLRWNHLRVSFNAQLDGPLETHWSRPAVKLWNGFEGVECAPALEQELGL